MYAARPEIRSPIPTGIVPSGSGAFGVS